MDKAQYQAVKAQLDFSPKLHLTLLILGVELLATIFFVKLEPSLKSPIYWLIQPLLAIFFFHHFSILHECGHGNISQKRILNTIIGHYASFFCFMPYFPWKYIHAKHHIWSGNLDQDPTLRGIRTYDPNNKILNGFLSLAWRSIIPIFALIQHLVLWTYPLTIFEQYEKNKNMLWRCVFSVFILIGVYTVGLAFGFPWQLFIPAIFIYLVLTEWINFPHHLGLTKLKNDERLPLWEHTKTTRSCYYPNPMAELLLLNFNFHVEHHFFPTLPWHELRKARTLIRDITDYQESLGFSWSKKQRQNNFLEVFK